MDELLVNVSPHIRHEDSTQSIMRDILIALIPAVAVSVALFGARALLVEAATVAGAVIFEWGFERLCGRPSTVGDLSAAVTGLLLALNLPVSIPLWQSILGAFAAIVLVKQLFGGIGRNLANPALTARVLLLLSFPGSMMQWITPDGVTSATPLATLGNGGATDLLGQFLGVSGGCLGETCVLALMIGFAYLLYRHVISWHTPVAFIGTVFVLSLLRGGASFALGEILGGGLCLGAIFMATDYTTTPQTNAGKLVFGFGCGLLTCLIRFFGIYPEGVSFSILFMNLLTPHIRRWTAKKPIGGSVG